MKIKKSKIIVFVALFIILFNMPVVFGNEINTSGYSKKFQEWMELPEEEREGTIAPLPFNIRKESEGFTSKLWTFFTSVRIPDKYDLRENIDFLEVKDQMSTGQCWAFSANSSVETYLALNERRNILFF